MWHGLKGPDSLNYTTRKSQFKICLFIFFHAFSFDAYFAGSALYCSQSKYERVTSVHHFFYLQVLPKVVENAKGYRVSSVCIALDV